jgi:hypothetical protein
LHALVPVFSLLVWPGLEGLCAHASGIGSIVLMADLAVELWSFQAALLHGRGSGSFVSQTLRFCA